MARTVSVTLEDEGGTYEFTELELERQVAWRRIHDQDCLIWVPTAEIGARIWAYRFAGLDDGHAFARLVENLTDLASERLATIEGGADA